MSQELYGKIHKQLSNLGQRSRHYTGRQQIMLNAMVILLRELDKALVKYDPMPTHHHGIGIILEEFKELQTEVFKKDHMRNNAALIEEAAHTAATAMRFIIDLCMMEAKK